MKGRRQDRELTFTSRADEVPGPLIPDTCAYIDGLRGQLPASAIMLADARLVSHSAIVQAELVFAIGALDPKDPRSVRASATIRELVESMPSHRLLHVDAAVTIAAGALAGTISRIMGYGQDNRRRALFDAMLYLQARKSGHVVLTRNIADFDLLQQMEPDGKVLFYRLE